MLLQNLKQKLQILTGTNIGEVFFDFKEYSDKDTTRLFPVVVWNLDSATFETDYRTATIQKWKIITLTAFAINVYPIDGDRITVWDTLEGYFQVYMNAMDQTAGIQILNIDKLKGQYLGQDIDKGEITIGMMFQGVQIKLWC
jgi:hypothetical protein